MNRSTVYNYSLGSCRDINECLRNPCGENESCRNFEGGYECSCLKNFAKNSAGLCTQERSETLFLNLTELIKYVMLITNPTGLDGFEVKLQMKTNSLEVRFAFI